MSQGKSCHTSNHLHSVICCRFMTSMSAPCSGVPSLTKSELVTEQDLMLKTLPPKSLLCVCCGQQRMEQGKGSNYSVKLLLKLLVFHGYPSANQDCDLKFQQSPRTIAATAESKYSSFPLPYTDQGNTDANAFSHFSVTIICNQKITSIENQVEQ